MLVVRVPTLVVGCATYASRHSRSITRARADRHISLALPPLHIQMDLISTRAHAQMCRLPYSSAKRVETVFM
jgi:hypothetical protein